MEVSFKLKHIDCDVFTLKERAEIEQTDNKLLLVFNIVKMLLNRNF